MDLSLRHKAGNKGGSIEVKLALVTDCMTSLVSKGYFKDP